MSVHLKAGWRLPVVATVSCLVMSLMSIGTAVSAAPVTHGAQKIVLIPLDTPPNGVAVDAATDTIYAESASGQVYVIDGKTNKVVATVDALSPAPEGIVVDPATDLVYTFSYGGAHAVVTVINGKTKKVSKVFAAGSPGQAGLAIDPKTDRLYIAKNNNHPSVTVINTTNDKVLKNIPVGPFPGDLGRRRDD